MKLVYFQVPRRTSHGVVVGDLMPKRSGFAPEPALRMRSSDVVEAEVAGIQLLRYPTAKG